MSDNDYDYEFSDREDQYSGHSDNGSSVHGSDFEYEGGGRNGEEDDQDQYEGDVADDNSSLLMQPSLQMCTKHKPGAMVEICKVCSTALAMVRPEVAKQWLAPVPVAPQPSALSRYSGRSDEKPPTLVFSLSTLELAYNTFTQGRFRGKSHFPDLVKKFLTLPPDQHEKLVPDLKLETFFKKLEGEKRFKKVEIWGTV